MLMGEYHHNIDEKSRLIIPSKFRNELGDRIIITRGLDNCLFAYSEPEWQRIVVKLNHLSFTKKDARVFMRMFLSGAVICEFDKQGRINITSPLSEYAKITKECVILGVNERIEIWSKESYDAFFNENAESFTELSENLFDGVDIDAL